MCHRAAVVLLIASATACSGILDTTNPLLIRNKDLTNATGAEGRRVALIQGWQDAHMELAWHTAKFSDEEALDAPLVTNYQYDLDWLLDMRDTATMQVTLAQGQEDPVLARPTVAFWESTMAIAALKAYGAPALKEDYLAQSFALRGHIVLLMAEAFCSGFPLNDATPDNLPLYSRGVSTDSALNYAVAQFDSSLVHIKDSTQFANLARVLKGRALLDLGRYADAATTVQAVPNNFVYAPEFISSGNIFTNEYMMSWDDYDDLFFVPDRKGGNGLPYVSERDTIRVPVKYLGQRRSEVGDSMFVQAKYTDQATPIPVATGLEAQLIKIEAAYQANDPSWFITLNALRTNVGLTAITTMPATDTGKVNLIFHERAFWLFRTGHRLGDMRRLLWRYNRTPATVFPTGDYPIFGLKYGNATAIPYITKLQASLNPVLSSSCTEGKY